MFVKSEMQSKEVKHAKHKVILMKIKRKCKFDLHFLAFSDKVCISFTKEWSDDI